MKDVVCHLSRKTTQTIKWSPDGIEEFVSHQKAQTSQKLDFDFDFSFDCLNGFSMQVLVLCRLCFFVASAASTIKLCVSRNGRGYRDKPAAFQNGNDFKNSSTTNCDNFGGLHIARKLDQKMPEKPVRKMSNFLFVAHPRLCLGTKNCTNC